MEGDEKMIDCSFLEVSINSGKLNQLLERLTKQTHENATEIRVLREVLPKLRQSVSELIEGAEQKLYAESSRSELRVKEEILKLRTEFIDTDRRLAAQCAFTKSNAEQTESQMSSLSAEQRINESKRREVAELNAGMQKELLEKIEGLKIEMEKMKRQENASNEKKVVDLFERMSSQVKKSNSALQAQISEISKNIKNRNSNAKVVEKSNLVTGSHFGEFTSQMFEVGKKIEKSNKPTNPIINLNKLENKENEVVINNEEAREIKYERSSEYSENQNIDLQLAAFQKEIDNYKNKMIVHEEKLAILSRKFDKERQSNGELKLRLMKFEDRRTDEQFAESWKKELNKLHHEFSIQIDQKLALENYEREQEKLWEKMAIIQENLIEKAEKAETRKLFAFAEEKIKQIVLLIANEHTEECDGAVRRFPAKCLSCDRTLETERIPTIRLPSPRRQIRTRLHPTSSPPIL